MAKIFKKHQAIFYPDELKTFQSWIRNCKANHPECVAQGPGPFFPTRLLDVRKDKVKLVNGCDLKSSNGGYIALSYCWGKTMPESGKTTRETLEARLAGIEFKLLPRTLREAIYVTRSLGIPFIWIDALCIIQGDEADWGKQCSMMAQVYSQAIVTIAAAMGNHCDEGFITKEKVKLRRKIRLKMKSSADNDSENSEDLHILEREDSPLHSRDWTLQELQLSTRIIEFCDIYNVWQCRIELIYYDTSRKHTVKCHNVDTTFDFNLDGLLRCFDLLPTDEDEEDNGASLYKRWRLMVQDFTGRQLTVATDKLPAFSGLAVAMQKYTKSEYLAGNMGK
jgi:hypothetical protein